MEVAYILQKYYSLTPNSLTPALSKGEGEREKHSLTPALSKGEGEGDKHSLTPALSKGEGEGSYLSFFFSFFLPLLWRGLG